MPTSIDVPKGRVRNASEWKTRHYEVTAAETFEPGDHVYLDGSGTLAIAAADGNDVGNIRLLGIAQAFAADCLANSRKCPVLCPINPAAEFLTAVYHSTGVSAVYAATDIDGAATTVTVPLRNQGGNWVANRENNSTNDRVVITERHDKYPYSTQYGWFWCHYLTAGASLDQAT